MEEYKDFVHLLVLYKDADIVIVKSLLESEHIPYYVGNENFSKAYGCIGVNVFVACERIKDAQEVLKTFL